MRNCPLEDSRPVLVEGDAEILRIRPKVLRLANQLVNEREDRDD